MLQLAQESIRPEAQTHSIPFAALDGNNTYMARYSVPSLMPAHKHPLLRGQCKCSDFYASPVFASPSSEYLVLAPMTPVLQ